MHSSDDKPCFFRVRAQLKKKTHSTLNKRILRRKAIANSVRRKFNIGDVMWYSQQTFKKWVTTYPTVKMYYVRWRFANRLNVGPAIGFTLARRKKDRIFTNRVFLSIRKAEPLTPWA